MAEETKTPVTPEKEVKTVKASDLFALKEGARKRESQLKAELEEVRGALADANAALKVAKVNVEDDEETAKVRTYLLEQHKELERERKKLEKDLASHKEREREVRAKELASKYGVDIESISTEEDMEKEAYRLYAERLAKEKEELEKKTPESVYESSPGGTVKVQPKDMPTADFDKYYERLKKEALLKR